MSIFICTECGAVFEGPLDEAAEAAFEHTAEHEDGKVADQQFVFAGLD